MAKLSPQLLNSTDSDDWNDFYLDSGKEILSLGAKLLESKKSDDVALGLKIVNRSYFEEHAENPESATGIEKLNFADFLPLLVPHLKSKVHMVAAIKGIHVCLLQGASAKKLNPKSVTPFLEDKKLKDVAFRILVHFYFQQKEDSSLIPLMKKSKSLGDVLTDELSTYAARDYKPSSPSSSSPATGPSAAASAALKGLEKKGEGPQRTAVETLWKLLLAGEDVSAALPLLASNEARLGSFTDSNQLIAGLYLKAKMFEQLTAWVMSADSKQAARGLRGLRLAHIRGISADEFLKKTGLKEKLIARANELRVPTLDEES